MTKKLPVPLVIGTEIYSGAWGITYSASEINEILDFALQNSVTEIDTAASYGENHFVEKLIGSAISGTRRSFIIATKFRQNLTNNQVGTPITKLVDLQRNLSDSLESLRTDYIDIYYFHSGNDKEFFQDDIWKFLGEMRRQGVVRRLGLSLNHGLVKSESYAQLKAAENYGISVIQTVLNMYSQESLQFVLPFCKSHGLTVYGRMPLAKGLLSGKYSKSSTFSDVDPRSKDLRVTTDILEFVENNNRPITVERAIQWSLEYAEKIVLGVKNRSQLESAINACEGSRSRIN